MPPWKPGETGNPAGRPRSRPITAAIKDLLDKNDGEAIKALAAVGLKNALKGDFRYFKELAERIDGKVLTELDLTSGGEAMGVTPGLPSDVLAEAMAIVGKGKHDGPQTDEGAGATGA